MLTLRDINRALDRLDPQTFIPRTWLSSAADGRRPIDDPIVMPREERARTDGRAQMNARQLPEIVIPPSNRAA